MSEIRKQIEQLLLNRIKLIGDNEQIYIGYPNDLINEIQSLISRSQRETIQEMIDLSDLEEEGHETEFNEWKAFKSFRNAMRDKLKSLKE